MIPVATLSTNPPQFIRAEVELIREDLRRRKAVSTKDLGSPIEIPGKALALQVRGDNAWIAENDHLVRKLDLETGKSLQVFRGHTAPVTCLAFFDKVQGSGAGDILITGSWDKTIKLWDVRTKALISSTNAHTDFVKVLLVIPALRLLVSGGSDFVVRLWDLSAIQEGKPLPSVGSISSHTRPVEALDARAVTDSTAVLYTADTMGIINVWDLTREDDDDSGGGVPPRWRSTLQDSLDHHRTRINAMVYGSGQLWTASSDDTVQVRLYPPSPGSQPRIPPIAHPTAVKALLPLALTPLAEPYLITGAGDALRAYDVSELDEPELLGTVDGHWHDVTALQLWMRRIPAAVEGGRVRVEPWIVSASLDGTIRRWKLSELLHPPPPKPAEEKKVSATVQMSEEEERELADLMDLMDSDSD
ncbi:WD40-repeat-containing domain protein [Sparassis latifolia]